jgi:hypothetical protein
MGKKNWSFLVFIVLFAACSSSETYFGPSQSSSNILRGLVFNSSGETELPLPVSIYVFDSLDKCVDIQTLQAGNDAFSFTLPIGEYTLSVISGASEEKYLLPDRDKATPDSPLLLKSPGDTHAELAVKTESISIGNNGVKDLTIIVDRVISQITASINDVPDDVTSVSISLEPLEEHLLLNGTYGGDGKGKITFALEKESPGLWKTPTPVFVLPGSDNVFVTTTFTRTNDSRDYPYSIAIPIEANCKTEIIATYKAESAEISGSIQCSDWKDEHEVTIDFGKSAPNEVLTQGDVYKTCYILDVLEESPKESTFLIMAPKGLTETTTEKVINSSNIYACGDLANWRPLTIDEARTLHTICSQRLDELNSLLIHDINPEQKYLCTDPDQTSFYYFTMNAPFKTTPAQSGVKYYSRFVKEVTVKW